MVYLFDQILRLSMVSEPRGRINPWSQTFQSERVEINVKDQRAPPTKSLTCIDTLKHWRFLRQFAKSIN